MPLHNCRSILHVSIHGNRRSAPCAATADRGGRGDCYLQQYKILKAPLPPLVLLSPPVSSLQSGDRTSCRRRDTSERRTGSTLPTVATPDRCPCCSSPTRKSGGREHDSSLRPLFGRTSAGGGSRTVYHRVVATARRSLNLDSISRSSHGN